MSEAARSTVDRAVFPVGVEPSAAGGAAAGSRISWLTAALPALRWRAITRASAGAAARGGGRDRRGPFVVRLPEFMRTIHGHPDEPMLPCRSCRRQVRAHPAAARPGGDRPDAQAMRVVANG